jgi:hypothetical protein
MKDITLKTEKDTLKTEGALLPCHVSDEALESAGGASREPANFTLGSCTNLSECPDPLSPSRPDNRQATKTEVRQCVEAGVPQPDRRA